MDYLRAAGQPWAVRAAGGQAGPLQELKFFHNGVGEAWGTAVGDPRCLLPEPQ